MGEGWIVDGNGWCMVLVVVRLVTVPRGEIQHILIR